MRKCPCENCCERKITSSYNCHSNCEKYLEYKALLEKEKAFQKSLTNNAYTAGSIRRHNNYLKDEAKNSHR